MFLTHPFFVLYADLLQSSPTCPRGFLSFSCVFLGDRLRSAVLFQSLAGRCFLIFPFVTFYRIPPSVFSGQSFVCVTTSQAFANPPLYYPCVIPLRVLLLVLVVAPSLVFRMVSFIARSARTLRKLFLLVMLIIVCSPFLFLTHFELHRLRCRNRFFYNTPHVLWSTDPKKSPFLYFVFWLSFSSPFYRFLSLILAAFSTFLVGWISFHAILAVLFYFPCWLVRVCTPSNLSCPKPTPPL